MDLARLAQRQLKDYDRHCPGTLFAGYPVAMTIDEAYALQFAVAGLRVRRGERVAGYKVGCVSPTVQSQLGLDSPVFGHVFSTELYTTGAVLHSANFDGLAVEGEFALRIACDIPGAEWLHRHQEAAVSSWFAVVELHNYVFRNSPHNAQELIGNNTIHAGVVLPALEPPLADPAELAGATVQVLKNDLALGTASASCLPDGPLGSLHRLVDHLGKHGRRLRPGDLVLTGSPLPLYPITSGDRVEIRGGPAGPVTCRCD